jgi:hypothetical protein
MPIPEFSEQLHELRTKDTHIQYGKFIYPCRYRHNIDAKYLNIQLQGALPPRDGTIVPFFARWNWGKILGAHVLSICDPTIYLDETLRVGWYLGTRADNAIEGIVAIAESFADSIGVDHGRIVYSGSSGGGFAALQAACMMPNGKAIAINPQTNLVKYDWSLIHYIKGVSGCSSIEEAQRYYGDRFNVINSLKQELASGHVPRIVYVQNINDEEHYQTHFIPFVDEFGLDRTALQSVNGTFMSLLYDGPQGHVAESKDEVTRIINEGIPFLLDLEIDMNISDLSVEVISKDKTISAIIDLLNRKEGAYEYACYLIRNNLAVEKRSYQKDRQFIFDVPGAGKYKCLGFARYHTGSISLTYSKDINIETDQL